MEKVFACATAMAAPSASPGHHDEDDDQGDHHDYQDNDWMIVYSDNTYT